MRIDVLKAVYISNFGAHNYAPAARFGAVVPLTNGNYPIFRTARLVEEITQGLKNSTEDDYLLLSGSSIIAGIALAVWLTYHDKCNLLLYDRKTEEYVPRSISGTELTLQVEATRDTERMDKIAREMR